MSKSPTIIEGHETNHRTDPADEFLRRNAPRNLGRMGRLASGSLANDGDSIAPPDGHEKKSRRRCTPEYDLRLSRYLGTSPGFWLRLQLDYELMRTERENGERISREVQPHAA